MILFRHIDANGLRPDGLGLGIERGRETLRVTHSVAIIHHPRPHFSG